MKRWTARQLRPVPRIAAGRALAGIATAMIDLSDGLAVDLSRLLSASGAGCSVDPDAIPADPGLEGIGLDRIETALIGGEDFELLFTAPVDRSNEIDDRLAAAGTDVTCVGEVTDGATLIGGDALDTWKERSWDHLRPL